MEKHPIHSLMDSSMQSIRDMVDVNTVLGDAIIAKDGSTVLPVSKVSFGFVAGGGEYDTDRRAENAPDGLPFAGGSGAGVSVQPVGFLVVDESGVKMLPAQHLTPLERALNCAPQLIEDVKELLSGKQEKPEVTP